ncbi:MAG: hypothetical protein CYPHOPRED_001276 [Cyphobasidiales sp. Tagirdzhanova-0007]|nr:MAG: hypothetical protein CYPHOPRED_001276 [Cyphobasidiales sp. Tagirdzhanova-0007]
MASRIIPVVFVGLAAFSQIWLVPKLSLLGVIGNIVQLDIPGCLPIPGLEACEDQWIHRSSGISYLPCSHIGARAEWTPALDLLNGTGINAYPSDEILMYDTQSGSISPIRITNRPVHLHELHLHGIDAFIQPDDEKRLTFFLINHAVPEDKANAHHTGADSTIEIFQTTLGSLEWQWVSSVSHELMIAPNNIMATGPRQFYFTNDHNVKVSWTRILSVLAIPGGKSDIVYCDTTLPSSPTCFQAATGFYHPNGIARGPDSTLYVASSSHGTVTAMEMQADHTLVQGEVVASVGSVIDNIQVTEDGEILLAGISRLLDFAARVKNADGKSSAQVWHVKNETSENRFHGKHYSTSLIFSDGTGDIAPTLTNAHLYKDKLYLTGLTTPTLLVCPVGRTPTAKRLAHTDFYNLILEILQFNASVLTLCSNRDVRFGRNLYVADFESIRLCQSFAMPPKGNAKAQAAREAKSGREADKKAGVAAAKEEAEDEEWNKGAKKDKAVDKAAKAAAAKEAKQAREAALAEEEASIKTKSASPKAGPKGSVKKPVAQAISTSGSGRESPNAAGPETPKRGQVPDFESALNAPVESFTATNIDDALDLLSLVNEKSDKSSVGSRAAQLDVDVFYHFSALASYKERELPLVRKERPGLRLNQYEEIIYKNFKKAPENPFNQVSVAFDASKEEKVEALKRLRKETERRLKDEA